MVGSGDYVCVIHQKMRFKASVIPFEDTNLIIVLENASVLKGWPLFLLYGSKTNAHGKKPPVSKEWDNLMQHFYPQLLPVKSFMAGPKLQYYSFARAQKTGLQKSTYFVFK